MSIADDKDQTKSEGVYKMLKKEKELLDTFMYAMNTGLTFNKGNIDVNGKATISEPETGRPIYIGEGLIPQIAAAANKYAYRFMFSVVNRLMPYDVPPDSSVYEP